MSNPIQVPVLIIGGGGCGLNLSCFLSDYGVKHVLFERHPGTSILPKAHYLSQRTMEIWRQHNMEDAIQELSCPVENMGQIDWRTSLGGTASWHGRKIGRAAAFGNHPGSSDYAAYRRDSPSLSTNLPLIRSEPIFRRIAEERNPGGIHFSTTVINQQDKDDHVLVTVRGPDGKEVQYAAQYVIGADGGKTVGAKIGVKMEGLNDIVDFVSCHFKADLSKYWDDRTIITLFINPEGESLVNFGCGVLTPMGPTWGKNSEEWTLHFGARVGDPEQFDADKMIARLRDLLRLPDLDIDVLAISHWVLQCVLANKYREGRIFIAGDSAHRHPPTTGLGMNTAIQDAHNLAWKLAFVLHGKADATLLDTYEPERRAVGKRNCDWALFSFNHLGVVDAAIGLVPGDSKASTKRLEDLYQDTPHAHAQLEQIQRAIDLQDIEFSAHDIELGFSYDSRAVVSDGAPKRVHRSNGRDYHPTTRPGHRLPHAWLENESGKVSTHDLIGRATADFVLITDEFGLGWIDAAEEVAKATGVKIAVAPVATRRHIAGWSFYEDTVGQWVQVREIADGGAVLVRPDNMVAWRSHELGSSASLLAAVQKILGKGEPTAVVNGLVVQSRL